MGGASSPWQRRASHDCSSTAPLLMLAILTILRLRRESDQKAVMDSQRRYTVYSCSGGAASDWWPWQTARLAHGLTSPWNCPGDDLQEQHIAVGRMRADRPNASALKGPWTLFCPHVLHGQPSPPRTETRRQRTLLIGTVVFLLEASAMLSRRWCWRAMSP